MEEVEYIKKLEESYAKDIAELNAEIARLKRERDAWRDRAEIIEKERDSIKRQVRHV